MAFTYTDHPFGTADVSQIFNSVSRGDLTVFNLQNAVDGGIIVMRYLGNGQVEFGPLFEDYGGGEFGPWFVYDDILVMSQNLGGAYYALVTLKINTDLSITPVDSDFGDITWSKTHLVDSVAHQVYVFTDDLTLGSWMERVSVSATGVISGRTTVWSDPDYRWVYSDSSVKIDESTFLDSVNKVKISDSTATFLNAVIHDFSVTATPVIGTIEQAPEAASAFWSNPLYASLGEPDALGRFWISQDGAYAEMERSGTAIAVSRSFGGETSTKFLGTPRYLAAGTVLTEAAEKVSPYPGSFLYDFFGTTQEYYYDLPAGREDAGTSPSGALNNDFFYVHCSTSFSARDAQIRIWYSNIGQLYVNLSTTKNSPNWVSVCDTVNSLGYFNSSEIPALPTWNRVHRSASGGIAGGSGGSSGYIYWSESDEFITRWNTATDEIAYGFFSGENPGAMVAGANKLWVNAYATSAGFELNLDMGSRANWSIPSASLHQSMQDYRTGGLYDPSTGKFWLQADYQPPDHEYTWVSFSSDGTFLSGHADDYLLNSGAEVSDGTSPALVDGWLYRNANVSQFVDRFNLSTGAWEFFQPSGNQGVGQLIGYHPSYGLIFYDFYATEFRAYAINSFAWHDMLDYGNQPSLPLPTPDFTWSPISGMNLVSYWGAMFVNDGAIYVTVSDGVYGVDYGWTGTVGGVSPTAWGWRNSIKSLDLATGAVTTRLQIPHRWVDATGAPTDENNAGFNPGYSSPFGFTGTPITGGSWSPIYANISTTGASEWWLTCPH